MAKTLNQAAAEYQAAKVNFIKAGLEYHSAYADYDIGRIFNCLQKFDDAETYQKRALKYAESIDMLVKAAIEKDRERKYLGDLTVSLWGADYKEHAEELSAQDDNFRRIYKRLYAVGI